MCDRQPSRKRRLEASGWNCGLMMTSFAGGGGSQQQQPCAWARGSCAPGSGADQEEEEQTIVFLPFGSAHAQDYSLGVLPLQPHRPLVGRSSASAVARENVNDDEGDAAPPCAAAAASSRDDDLPFCLAVEDYPSYCSLLPWDLFSIHHVTPSGYVLQQTTPDHLLRSPLLTERKRTSGFRCKSHGPFPCSCKFVAELATTVKTLRREFPLPDTREHEENRRHRRKVSSEEAMYPAGWCGEEQEEEWSSDDPEGTTGGESAAGAVLYRSVSSETFEQLIDALLCPLSSTCPRPPAEQVVTPSSGWGGDSSGAAAATRGFGVPVVSTAPPPRRQPTVGLNLCTYSTFWENTLHWDGFASHESEIVGFLRSCTSTLTTALLLVQYESKKAALVITAPEIPLPVSCRVIGPFSLAAGDKEETLRLALKTGLEQVPVVASPVVPLPLPPLVASTGYSSDGTPPSGHGSLGRESLSSAAGDGLGASAALSSLSGTPATATMAGWNTTSPPVVAGAGAASRQLNYSPFPECYNCEYRGMSLRECAICQRVVCYDCAKSCYRCHLDHAFCGRCAVTCNWNSDLGTAPTACKECLK